MDLISTNTDAVLHKALDGLMARHNAISSNLANVDTPGYKAIKVDFENKLQEAVKNVEGQKESTKQLNMGSQLDSGYLKMNTTDTKHIGAHTIKPYEVGIKAYQEDSITVRSDGNAVDIDTETTELAKNTMKYQAVAQFQGKNFRMMQELLKGLGGA